MQYGRIFVGDESVGADSAEVILHASGDPSYATWGKFGIPGQALRARRWANARFCIMAKSRRAAGNWTPAANPVIEFRSDSNHDPDQDTQQEIRNGDSCWETIVARPGYTGLTAPGPRRPGPDDRVHPAGLDLPGEAAAVRRDGGPIRLHTLGVGQPGAVDLEVLDSLATGTSGRSFAVGDNQPSVIENAMIEINAKVRGGIITTQPVLVPDSRGGRLAGAPPTTRGAARGRGREVAGQPARARPASLVQHRAPGHRGRLALPGGPQRRRRRPDGQRRAPRREPLAPRVRCRRPAAARRRRLFKS